MAANFDGQNVEMSEVFEGISAVLLAPVVLPLASAVNQPLVKSAIKEGIAFSERCQEAVADAQERLEDMFAEAQAEVDAERSADPDNQDVMNQPVFMRLRGYFNSESRRTSPYVSLEWIKIST